MANLSHLSSNFDRVLDGKDPHRSVFTYFLSAHKFAILGSMPVIGFPLYQVLHHFL